MDTAMRLLVRFLRDHPGQAASSLERLAAPEIRALLEDVPADAAAASLASLPPRLGAECLSEMSETTAAQIVREMPVAAAGRLLRRMEPEHRRTLLAALPIRFRNRLNTLLEYAENTVGSIMEQDFVQLAEDRRADDALDWLREQGHPETGTVYVVGPGGEIKGTVEWKQLAAAPAGLPAGSVTRPARTLFSPNTGCETALAHPCWMETDEAPVAARDGVLVGVLHHRVLRAWSGGRRDTSQDQWDAAIGIGETLWLGMQELVETVITVTKRS